MPGSIDDVRADFRKLLKKLFFIYILLMQGWQIRMVSESTLDITRPNPDARS